MMFCGYCAERCLFIQVMSWSIGIYYTARLRSVVKDTEDDGSDGNVIAM